MAVKKKAIKKKVVRRKSTAVAKRGSTAMSTSDWEEKLAEMATTDAARTGTASESSVISIKGGKFKFQDENLGTEMEVVILEYGYAREYYDCDYDPDNPLPPACFALGSDIDAIEVPDEKSPAPQADACADCPQDEWGSSNFGQSKACGAKVVLAVADYEGITDENYEHAMIRAGVNSMKNFNAFVKNLSNKTKRPPFGVVTKITFDDDADYPVLKFALVNMIDDEAALEAIMERKEGLIESITTPHYNVDAYEAPKAKGRKKVAKKKVTRRSKFSK